MATNRKHLISASANIPAPPQRAYSILANYRDEHPRILPPQFSNLAVEKGGIGAGTVIRFNMRVFGRKRSFRAAVTEPEPGRVLVETDLDTNRAVTTFIVDSGAVPGQMPSDYLHRTCGSRWSARKDRAIPEYTTTTSHIRARTGTAHRLSGGKPQPINGPAP